MAKNKSVAISRSKVKNTPTDGCNDRLGIGNDTPALKLFVMVQSEG
jgi:hypothetical protein